ncbi:hypothetical protein Salat_1114700 [Sesamum alatum]|uniref:Uncharacterized protein n=1 Tax=Sesamum alatum TaxID=300844 RepID=A0AAE1YNY3_9LAMI|nr:hypothetical protein Salat_1114700 [Sesamum alatum]
MGRAPLRPNTNHVHTIPQPSPTRTTASPPQDLTRPQPNQHPTCTKADPSPSPALPVTTTKLRSTPPKTHLLDESPSALSPQFVYDGSHEGNVDSGSEASIGDVVWRGGMRGRRGGRGRGRPGASVRQPRGAYKRKEGKQVGSSGEKRLKLGSGASQTRLHLSDFDDFAEGALSPSVCV